MLISETLFYKKFRKYLECTVFEFNTYDPFVANKTMNGKIGSNHTCG